MENTALFQNLRKLGAVLDWGSSLQNKKIQENETGLVQIQRIGQKSPGDGGKK